MVAQGQNQGGGRKFAIFGGILVVVAAAAVYFGWLDRPT